MNAVSVCESKGSVRERGAGKVPCCFRIGGSEFALIERNVPPRLSFIRYPLFFIV